MANTFTRESHGFSLRVEESGNAWLVWIRRLSESGPIKLWAVFDDEKSAKRAACKESRHRAGLPPIDSPSDCDCESLWTERHVVPLKEGPSTASCPRCRKTAMTQHVDRTPEAQNIVLIRKAIVRRAEQLILSCESCDPENAQFPFDYVLDWVTGQEPGATDYLMERPAKCPTCWRAVSERTLVDWAAG